jgi:hypothetical protein
VYIGFEIKNSCTYIGFEIKNSDMFMYGHRNEKLTTQVLREMVKRSYSPKKISNIDLCDQFNEFWLKLSEHEHKIKDVQLTKLETDCQNGIIASMHIFFRTFLNQSIINYSLRPSLQGLYVFLDCLFDQYIIII